jgi:hypothetical protein
MSKLNAPASGATGRAEPLAGPAASLARVQGEATGAVAATGPNGAEPGVGVREPEYQSPGGMWPLFGLAMVVLIALSVVGVVRQRSRSRRAAQDRALLEGSIPSGFPAAAPAELSAPPGALPEPPVSNRVAAVIADDRAARSGRPLSVPPSAPPGSLAPLSERQWQSQRPPRGHKDPQ